MRLAYRDQCQPDHNRASGLAVQKLVLMMQASTFSLNLFDRSTTKPRKIQLLERNGRIECISVHRPAQDRDRDHRY